jgi:hypothetical protein
MRFPDGAAAHSTTGVPERYAGNTSTCRGDILRIDQRNPVLHTFMSEAKMSASPLPNRMTFHML